MFPSYRPDSSWDPCDKDGRLQILKRQTLEEDLRKAREEARGLLETQNAMTRQHTMILRIRDEEVGTLRMKMKDLRNKIENYELEKMLRDGEDDSHAEKNGADEDGRDAPDQEHSEAALSQLKENRVIMEQLELEGKTIT